jgi:hypothetical protein
VKSIPLRCAIAAVALQIAWVFGTRPLARIVDRFVTVRVASLPVRPFAYDTFGGVKIGDWWMTIPVAELGDFLAEGNEISLTKERSYLSWPNPFEVNFMTGWKCCGDLRNIFTPKAGGLVPIWLPTNRTGLIRIVRSEVINVSECSRLPARLRVAAQCRWSRHA